MLTSEDCRARREHFVLFWIKCEVKNWNTYAAQGMIYLAVIILESNELKNICSIPGSSIDDTTALDSWKIYLKGVLAKTKGGKGEKWALLIATNLTSICCVYKEKTLRYSA